MYPESVFNDIKNPEKDVILLTLEAMNESSTVSRQCASACAGRGWSCARTWRHSRCTGSASPRCARRCGCRGWRASWTWRRTRGTQMAGRSSAPARAAAAAACAWSPCCTRGTRTAALCCEPPVQNNNIQHTHTHTCANVGFHWPELGSVELTTVTDLNNVQTCCAAKNESLRQNVSLNRFKSFQISYFIFLLPITNRWQKKHNGQFENWNGYGRKS